MTSRACLFAVILADNSPLFSPAQLAVVISSLAQGNPSLALSNIYGSSIANILGSFSLGLLVRPAELTGSDAASARLYTSVLVLLAAGIAALALPPVSARIGKRAGERGMIAGHAIGGVLIALFVLYVAGIAWGIYKGSMVAPEGSDSDSSDSDSDSDADSTAGEDRPVPEITGNGVQGGRRAGTQRRNWPLTRF